ncbi:DUF1963 domain-containing protein [Streptomyces sp. NPDC047097]|uniref:DUF1963 domain-containing protein n=1 Tax=Streptomyces sp. NPDC047097 TaxID=3155260 RepID=UPI0033CE6D46
MTSIIDERERRVRAAAGEYGVPDAVADALLAALRPCVYLVPFEELPGPLRDGARPAARTGGLPALPDGTDWPGGGDPLVLTVDCAALPAGVPELALPSDGWLLFFADIEYPPETAEVLHIPAGTRTTEHPATRLIQGEPAPIRVYEPRTLYAVAGLTAHGDWREAPEIPAAFAEPGGESADALDRFEDAVLASSSGGLRGGLHIQLGGWSHPWDMAPDEGEQVLLAQLHGQAVDYEVFTLTLVTGTRADIAAGRWSGLCWEQQC